MTESQTKMNILKIIQVHFQQKTRTLITNISTSLILITNDNVSYLLRDVMIMQRGQICFIAIESLFINDESSCDNQMIMHNYFNEAIEDFAEIMSREIDNTHAYFLIIEIHITRTDSP